jgi:hypothetical protein
MRRSDAVNQPGTLPAALALSTLACGFQLCDFLHKFFRGVHDVLDRHRCIAVFFRHDINLPKLRDAQMLGRPRLEYVLAGFVEFSVKSYHFISS